MFRKIVALALSVALVSAGPSVHAVSKKEKAGEISTQGPRRHLANIVFAGLAGAILGLSTLSFYGRPQDRLSNIAVGFAIGVIGGTVYTTYKAATEPKEFYSLREARPEAWTLADTPQRFRPASAPATAFTFEF